MQKFTQKYAIICLLEDIQEGYTYPSSDWPLHVTFVGTFAINWDVETIKQKLEQAAKEIKCATTKGIGDEYFGPNNEVHVILLEKNSSMNSIHRKLLDLLKQGNLKLNDPQFSEDGYLPHSTIQKHAKVERGEEIKINNLALIDMYPDEDPYQRRVLKLVKLNKL